MAKIGGWRWAYAYIPRRVFCSKDDGTGVEYGSNYKEFTKRWIWLEEYQRQKYSFWYPDYYGEDWLRREIPQIPTDDPSNPDIITEFNPLPDMTIEEFETITNSIPEDLQVGKIVYFRPAHWKRLDPEIKRHFQRLA